MKTPLELKSGCDIPQIQNRGAPLDFLRLHERDLLGHDRLDE